MKRAIKLLLSKPITYFKHFGTLSSCSYSKLKILIKFFFLFSFFKSVTHSSKTAIETAYKKFGNVYYFASMCFYFVLKKNCVNMLILFLVYKTFLKFFIINGESVQKKTNLIYVVSRISVIFLIREKFLLF